MRIIIGSDHRGFELKKYILDRKDQIKSGETYLMQDQIIDIGCYENKEIDFTDIVFDMIDKWSDNAMGILICKTGIGMSICANRFKNIRGAICVNIDNVISARDHNNINVLILGAENDNDNIIDMINAFLETKFNENKKYHRRVDKMSNIEG